MGATAKASGLKVLEHKGGGWWMHRGGPWQPLGFTHKTPMMEP